MAVVQPQVVSGEDPRRLYLENKRLTQDLIKDTISVMQMSQQISEQKRYNTVSQLTTLLQDIAKTSAGGMSGVIQQNRGMIETMLMNLGYNKQQAQVNTETLINTLLTPAARMEMEYSQMMRTKQYPEVPPEKEAKTEYPDVSLAPEDYWAKLIGGGGEEKKAETPVAPAKPAEVNKPTTTEEAAAAGQAELSAKLNAPVNKIPILAFNFFGYRDTISNPNDLLAYLTRTAAGKGKSQETAAALATIKDMLSDPLTAAVIPSLGSIRKEDRPAFEAAIRSAKTAQDVTKILSDYKVKGEVSAGAADMMTLFTQAHTPMDMYQGYGAAIAGPDTPRRAAQAESIWKSYPEGGKDKIDLYTWAEKYLVPFAIQDSPRPTDMTPEQYERFKNQLIYNQMNPPGTKEGTTLPGPRPGTGQPWEQPGREEREQLWRGGQAPGEAGRQNVLYRPPGFIGEGVTAEERREQAAAEVRPSDIWTEVYDEASGKNIRTNISAQIRAAQAKNPDMEVTHLTPAQLKYFSDHDPEIRLGLEKWAQREDRIRGTPIGGQQPARPSDTMKPETILDLGMSVATPSQKKFFLSDLPKGKAVAEKFKGDMSTLAEKALGQIMTLGQKMGDALASATDKITQGKPLTQEEKIASYKAWANRDADMIRAQYAVDIDELKKRFGTSDPRLAYDYFVTMATAGGEGLLQKRQLDQAIKQWATSNEQWLAEYRLNVKKASVEELATMIGLANEQWKIRILEKGSSGGSPADTLVKQAFEIVDAMDKQLMTAAKGKPDDFDRLRTEMYNKDRSRYGAAMDIVVTAMATMNNSPIIQKQYQGTWLQKLFGWFPSVGEKLKMTMPGVQALGGEAVSADELEKRLLEMQTPELMDAYQRLMQKKAAGK